MTGMIDLFTLQQSAVDDLQIRMVLAEPNAWIHASSFVHEKFHRTDLLSSVVFQERLQPLLSFLRIFFASPRLQSNPAARGGKFRLASSHRAA